VYAHGRPLWHLSIATRDPVLHRPIALDRVSAQSMQRQIAYRDTVFSLIGTHEQIIEERHSVFHWRKPLRLDEINRMAQTPEVRARRGRP
jgi:hypothetical protein